MLDDGCKRFLLALVPLAADVDELEAERRDAPVARPCALSTWSAADVRSAVASRSDRGGRAESKTAERTETGEALSRDGQWVSVSGAHRRRLDAIERRMSGDAGWTRRRTRRPASRAWWTWSALGARLTTLQTTSR